LFDDIAQSDAVAQAIAMIVDTLREQLRADERKQPVHLPVWDGKPIGTLTREEMVVTHPKRVTHPKSPEEALNAIAVFLVMPGMLLLRIPPDIVSRWMELVRRYPQSECAEIS
jgi:hypothetical protein